MSDTTFTTNLEKKKRKRNKKNKKNARPESFQVPPEVDSDEEENEDDMLNFLNMSPSAQTLQMQANKLATQELNAYESNHMGEFLISKSISFSFRDVLSLVFVFNR